MLFSQPVMLKSITNYGNSMLPTIRPGQIIKYSPQVIGNNNDIAVAIINHVFYIRRLQINDTKMVLVPDNPEFDCIPVKPDQIIGIVPEMLLRRY